MSLSENVTDISVSNEHCLLKFLKHYTKILVKKMQ